MSFHYLGNSYFFDIVRRNAESILEQNLLPASMNGLLYRRTVPSRQYYTHQWNWDSAVHAMALVHVSPTRALEELLSLVSGQWPNGLIPHMVFNSSAEQYFPSPAFWGTEKFAHGDIVSSGITQPPLIGTSLAYIAQALRGKKEFSTAVEVLTAAVIRYHNNLKKYRDPEDSGLLSLVHPWEAGNDNSPLWDEALLEIPVEKIPDQLKQDVDRYRSDIKKVGKNERPNQDFYYRSMYLVWLYKSWGWDYEIIMKKSPFIVKDVLFNSIWARSNEVLAELLHTLKRPGEAKKYTSWAKQTQSALASTWDESFKQFYNIDVVNKRRVIHPTNSIFAPLLAGAVDESRIDSLLQRLSDPQEFWTAYPVPTVSVKDPLFERSRYWRGPSWPITNLFIIEGLDRYKTYEKARKLRDALLEKTFEMIIRQGFFEYYDPLEGRGRGFGNFSWSAAVFIYLQQKYKM